MSTSATKRDDRLKHLQRATVYLLVSEEPCVRPIETVVRDALSNGVGVVQLREKQLSDRKLVELGRQIQPIVHEYGGLLIMNDRPDLAVLTDADGVHVGQDELRVSDARQIVGDDRIVGVSTHSIAQVCQACSDGADYIGVGPTFPSGTKSFSEFPGLDLVREASKECDVPWFAIGGISARNIHEVREAGARRVAVSGALCGSEAPGAVAGELWKALGS